MPQHCYYPLAPTPGLEHWKSVSHLTCNKPKLHFLGHLNFDLSRLFPFNNYVVVNYSNNTTKNFFFKNLSQYTVTYFNFLLATLLQILIKYMINKENLILIGQRSEVIQSDIISHNALYFAILIGFSGATASISSLHIASRLTSYSNYANCLFYTFKNRK